MAARCWQTDVLPDASVASHVMLLTPSGNAPGALSNTFGAGSQRSEAVAIPSCGWLGHSATTSAEQEIRGGVVSCTVTELVQVARLPDASVAVNVTWVAPSG